MSKEITILIADDNGFIRETLRFIISRVKQFKLVGEATNGLEAISMTEKLLPDIILLDINMAPVNGFEATRKIIRQSPSSKIIGLSVHTELSYARNILQLGAKGYITKTSPHKEIIHAIQQVSAGNEYICEMLAGTLKDY